MNSIMHPVRACLLTLAVLMGPQVCLADGVTADAGPDQSVQVGDNVTLDGSASIGLPDDTLTYSWEFTAKPDGSTAALDDPSVVGPAFVVDRSGRYTLLLTVSDSQGDVTATDEVTVSTSTAAPVANAGTDQTVHVGDVVTLDGSGSSDSDGDILEYRWTLQAVPLGSKATLLKADTVAPTFTTDKPGDYQVELIVTAAGEESLPATVTVSTENSAPVANAGRPQTVHEGDTVTLYGTGTDVDGDKLTFLWTFTSKPTGSTAVLSGANGMNPTFVVDKSGNYLVSLIVNDGQLDSKPASVTVSTYNSAPVALAGPDQALISLSTLVSLDGRASYDPDGDRLSLRWAFVSKPSGSRAALQGANAATPTFFGDRYGTYVAQLIVTDSWGRNSLPANVRVSFDNIKPVANAGTSRSALLGQSVMLDGSGSSDANQDTLRYQWSLTAAPVGSLATIQSAQAVVAALVPDVEGTYQIQLVVNDGLLDSLPSTVQIQGYSLQSRAITDTQGCQTEIGVLDESEFRAPDMKDHILQDLNAVIGRISAGKFVSARKQLRKDNLKKTDGCILTRSPHPKDWIVRCETQQLVHTCLKGVVADLNALIRNR